MWRNLRQNLLNAISKQQLASRTTQFAAAFLLVCLIPYLHLGIFSTYVWPPKPPINQDKCTCECFDTVFRGSYERQPGGYKHWYFSVTLIAYKMWCLLALGVIVAYECFKHLTSLVLERDLRFSMLLVFASSVYPHYYGWWNYLNYYNEHVYHQWYHQLYFTITEIVSSAYVLALCRRSVDPQTYQLLVILSVNTSHILIGGLDQFLDNIIYKKGHKFQVVRDLGLVIPDFLAVFIALLEAHRLANKKHLSLHSLFYKEEIGLTFLITGIMVVVGKNIYF